MYSVPIIPNDLRHEETIIQAAYALDTLNQTINSIFDKIDKRIENNNVKVKDLSERICKAQSKIKSLIGTKKAIKLYAPSRFPASHIFQDIPATFDDNDSMFDNDDNNDEDDGNGNYVKNKINKKSYEVTSRAQNLQNLEDKLVFFHVRSSVETKFSNRLSIKEEIMQNSRDLQQRYKKSVIDRSLKSVSSILLFDSDDFAYGNENDSSGNSNTNDSWVPQSSTSYYRYHKDRKKIDEMAGSSSKKYQLLEPAPVSLQNRNRNRLTPAGDLRYMPRSKEAPEIDLPMDLPDLPGIADDIQYDFNVEKDIHIAPSLYGIHLPDLEELEKENHKKEKNHKSIPYGQQLNQSSYTKEINNSRVVTEAPPPPPPPPSTVLSAIPSAPQPPPPPPPPPPPAVLPSSFTPMTSPTSPPPPPPPPPPSSNSVSTSSPKIEDVSSQTVQKSLIIGDTHANLMESIRKAGGARGGHLKTTDSLDAYDAGRISSPKVKKKYVGNDLMMDLHNKLQMRRKGISGVNSQHKDANTNINPIIDHLSSLIPPPLHQKEQTKRSEEDEENEWTE